MFMLWGAVCIVKHSWHKSNYSVGFKNQRKSSVYLLRKGLRALIVKAVVQNYYFVL